MSGLVVGVWLALAAAGPEPLQLPGFRLHLVLSEELEPDRLEALARPGVVLWLMTRSNLLKQSVAERLGHADSSYVQVRPPLGQAGLQRQFTTRVHPWVELSGLDVQSYRRWAPAGTAVELSGGLTEERLAGLRALRASTVHWRPEEPPTLEEWARTAHLSGLEVRPPSVLPPCQRVLKGAERIRLRVPAGVADSSAAGCGFALRLEIPPSMSEADVRELLVAFPGAELWTEVRSEADASAAARLVAWLAAAVPPSHAVAPPANR
jgi:hypothetical protein